MPHTNEDLLNGRVQNDAVFVVTHEPREAGHSVVVDIGLTDSAVVLDKHASEYDQPYTIGDIRKGRGKAKGRNLWLLSGGTMIRDHRGRIAVALRDGNAADPFRFTNIGAGRCNDRFEAHCLEEMVSEFVLCVRQKNAGWVQVQLQPPAIPPLLSQIREQRQTIARWRITEVPVAGLLDWRRTSVRRIRRVRRGTKSLQVRWLMEGELMESENLQGYVVTDVRNHTTEFRLCYDLDLHAYRPGDVEIFSAEGTGYAKWVTRGYLRSMRKLHMVTPLLAVVP